MAENFWDRETKPIVINKNDKGDVIQVKKVMKNRGIFTDVRTWYRDRTDQLCPGKGIAIPDDLVDEVAQAMLDVAKAKFTDEEPVAKA